MLDWVAGAVESTKAAFGITKAMLAQRDEGMVQERVFELNGVLAGLQQQLLQGQIEQMQLLDELREAKKLLADLQETKQQNERYERFQTPFGSFVYRLKAEFAGTEVDHYLCSACFEKGSRVTMHQNSDLLYCTSCKIIAHLGHST